MEGKKRALITGIQGQDGALLARYLLKEGYEVHGIFRGQDSLTLWRLQKLDLVDDGGKPVVDLYLHDCDMKDESSLRSVLVKSEPNEIYHLAALSNVRQSYIHRAETYANNIQSWLNLITGIKSLVESGSVNKETLKIFNAGTSVMFEENIAKPDEESPFNPKSPYAAAKVFNFFDSKILRADGFKIWNGILFNHESPLRREDSITRKITIGLASVLTDFHSGPLKLGNLDTCRDWGDAEDFVKGMHAMLQSSKPDDYVMATGETHTVRDFIEAALCSRNIAFEWRGKGKNEKLFDKEGRVLFEIDPQFYGTNEKSPKGNPEKAKREFGWQAKTSFQALVKKMMDRDFEVAQIRQH